MRIDNSAAEKFWECPQAYRERYEHNLELTNEDREGLDFGSRFHELQFQKNASGSTRLRGYLDVPMADPRLEGECQATFAAYLQHYPLDTWETLDVERTLCVPLPNSHHEYVFKMDHLFRDPDGIGFLDYKTERRGGKSNTDLAWTARSQVSLYKWAASIYYNEPIRKIILDVTTRQSPKGQEPPLFHRLSLTRTQAQMDEAVRNITWVADQIENMQQSGFWPTNTKSCVTWKKCSYYALCHIGRTDGNLKLYRQAEPYLDIEASVGAATPVLP